MKKIYLLTVPFMLLAFLGLSQTTVNYNTHGHQIGDVVVWWNKMIPADSIYPGESGEDVTWNFTTHVSTNSFSNEYVDPANTPFADQAGSSNLAVYHNIVNNDAYTFCTISSESMQHMGGGWTEAGGQLYYDFADPVTLQTFPFEYEDEYSDSYNYSIDYNQLGYDMLVSISGTLTVVADAWGEIHTPLGVYDNVLRVQETYTEVVNTYIEGQLISANAIVEYFFRWYAPNRRASVYEYHYIAGDTVSHAILYSDNSLSVKEEQNHQVEIYPNPAGNHIRIKLENARDIQSIRLVNNLGQTVLKQDISAAFASEVVFQLSDLLEGFYLVNISMSNGEVINRKLLIKR